MDLVLGRASAHSDEPVDTVGWLNLRRLERHLAPLGTAYDRRPSRFIVSECNDQQSTCRFSRYDLDSAPTAFCSINSAVRKACLT